MAVNLSKKYGKSLSGKIIIALLLACAAVLLSFFITRLTFRKMLDNVQQLSAPNPRMQLVNKLFRSVVELDQLQRVQTLQMPSGKSYNPFFTESRDIRLMLDTLGMLSRNDLQQSRLVDSMQNILVERDQIFLRYLNLRSKFVHNDTLTEQIQELATSIASGGYHSDSNRVKTAEHLTTSTLEDVDTIESSEKRSFWDKITGRKKSPDYIERKSVVWKDLTISTDTFALAKQDSIIRHLTNALGVAESQRVGARNQLQKQQIQLNRTGSLLVSQLMGILRDIESEEMAAAQQNNTQINTLVNEGIVRMNTIIIVFIFVLAVLAFLIFTDIAGSNRYRKELVLAKDEAEQSGMVKQRFLANMSHEIRTPLQAILGIAEQWHKKGAGGKEDINIVYQSSRHLLQIVNQVLDYSLISSGSLKLERKSFSVAQLVDEVKAAMETEAAAKGLVFTYESTLDADHRHLGDPFRLKQVLYNLLGNAVKFTHRGGVTLTADKTDHARRTVFTFSVKDTGIGIAEGDIDRIFNQFEQGEKPDALSYQGTGLGLSIVKSLIESQHGTITVSSVPGEGSEFSFSVSYAEEKEEARSAVQSSVPDAFNGVVWVVDDDPFILKVFGQALTDLVITHRCFSSPAEALEAAAMAEADLSLMFIDIRMPGMSGFDLLDQLRPLLKEQVKYIAFTAQAMPDDRRKIKDHGFDGLLTKPFTEQDLNNLLGRLQSVERNAAGSWQSAVGRREDEESALENAVSVRDMGERRTLRADQPVFSRELVEGFIAETQKDLSRYSGSLDNDQPLEAAECLHRLAGRFGQVGYKPLSLELRSAELQIRNKGLWAEIMDTLRYLEEDIREELEALSVH
jgi:signal transduction histidine kinase/DNA-binding response OmpR family regulator